MAEEQKKYVGYGYHGGGRKKGSGSGTKRVVFQVSCQPEELEYIKELAEKAGMSKSAYMLSLLPKP